MQLYFAGAEVPSHRKVLAEVGASNVALSFMGLRRRIKHLDQWALADKFPEQAHILLDSGAFTVNKNPLEYTQGSLKEISEEYQEFVAANLDRVDAVTEFDAMALGREWVEEQREDFYEDIDPEKFIAIWHPEWGLDYLSEMAERYPRIGVPTTDIEGRNLTQVLNRLSESNSLHGVGVTKVADMGMVKWDSVSSTSWVSPQQYGDTIVWTGRELKRYPKKYKDQARKRYRTLFEREGFDAEAIANDDSSELLRLSIWSWDKLVEDIEHKAQRGLYVVTSDPETPSEGFTEVEGEEVDTQTGEMRKSPSTALVARRRATSALPVLGKVTHTETNDETGEEQEVSTVHLRSDSQRKCATCYLASKCPAFEQDSNCAYDIPLTIKTRSDFANLLNAMVEMQAQRVMFMRFAEELEGGYADPNLSGEVDRLTKMMKVKNDIESEGFSFKIEGKQVGSSSGQTGMLSRLFGNGASEKAQEIESGPVSVEHAEQIIDVEVLESAPKSSN